LIHTDGMRYSVLAFFKLKRLVQNVGFEYRPCIPGQIGVRSVGGYASRRRWYSDSAEVVVKKGVIVAEVKERQEVFRLKMDSPLLLNTYSLNSAAFVCILFLLLSSSSTIAEPFVTSGFGSKGVDNQSFRLST
jgi:hypothetical protein